MPQIRPFRGLRYNPKIVGDISQVVAPPYDIIYDEWRERLYDRNPYNIIRLIKTRTEPSDTGSDDKYDRAARHVEDWMREGALALDDEPAIYVRAETYDVNGETRTRYGFIALLRLEDFGNGIYPHERTLSGPKVDRLRLLQATHTNLSQVFSIFRDPKRDIQTLITGVAERVPDVRFTDEQGIERRMWAVHDPAVNARLADLIRGRDIIIADGHHRYETALNYRTLMESERRGPDEPFDYISMYFSSADDAGMTIFPTHRKVSEVSTYNQETFFAELRKLFDVTYLGEARLDDILRMIAVDAEHQNTYGMYTCDGFGIARYKSPANPKALDVDILHDIVIERLLGISREDIASGLHVHFSKSPEHAIEDVANHKDQITFLMNAVRPEELFRKVLQGGRMPQKSTYFYPKTMSGLVMYKLDRASLL